MKLIQGDCIEEMGKLIDEGIQVDLILTDPPYGTLKGASLKGWDKSTTEWDDTIPTQDMFDMCNQLLRMNGACILFSQEPYTSYLRQFDGGNLEFSYPLYWIKNHFANNLLCNKAPVNYVENMSVFHKKYDSHFQHPLRAYSKRLLDDLGTKKSIIDKIGGKADHFFRWNSSQFTLCTEETYNELIEVYHIDSFDYFKTFEELEEINKKFNRTFNRTFDNTQKYKSNVFKYDRPNNHYHPTEKPVDLLEDLILTFTNPNDLVLDFTMGSGSTGVACRNTGRDFIGIELDKEYYNIACDRINNYQERLV